MKLYLLMQVSNQVLQLTSVHQEYSSITPLLNSHTIQCYCFCIQLWGQFQHLGNQLFNLFHTYTHKLIWDFHNKIICVLAIVFLLYSLLVYSNLCLWQKGPEAHNTAGTWIFYVQCVHSCFYSFQQPPVQHSSASCSNRAAWLDDEGHLCGSACSWATNHTPTQLT